MMGMKYYLPAEQFSAHNTAEKRMHIRRSLEECHNGNVWELEPLTHAAREFIETNDWNLCCKETTMAYTFAKYDLLKAFDRAGLSEKALFPDSNPDPDVRCVIIRRIDRRTRK